MRKAALLFVIAVCAYAANAQLTLRPQLGVEAPLTKISYNNSSFYKAVCQSLPQAGVRADYQIKKGLTPYLGIVTHRPVVSYNFNDPKTGMTAYRATTGNLQLQLQAGLQYSIKPIALSKKTATSKGKQEKVSETKTNCYHSCQSACRGKSNEARTPKQQSNIWTLRLQPSAGIGYVPSGKQDIENINSGSSYTYNAGNIKTELITGLGFEFAKNRKRILTLGINYFKGLGTGESLLTTESPGSKPVNTTLRSKLSGWNAAIGIPISFAKKSATTSKQNNHRNCSDYYKKRCPYRF